MVYFGAAYCYKLNVEVEGSQWETTRGTGTQGGMREYSLVTHGDYVYSIGGWYYWAGYKQRYRVDRYDITTDSWARMGDFYYQWKVHFIHFIRNIDNLFSLSIGLVPLRMLGVGARANLGLWR